MAEGEVFPIQEEEESLGVPSRPRRWWVAGVVLMVAGALLATVIPGLLPQERTGSGTGFVIAEGGYVLTAAHVVRGATEVTVRWEGRGHRATTIAVSAEHDLALLLMEDAPPIPVATLAKDRPGFGDVVTAVGHPTGAAQPIALTTLVVGVGWWAVGPEGTVLRDLIATQEPFRPGYSGAPLVTEAGQVVGIVTGSLTSRNGQELGFAVSISRAADWLAGRGMPLPLVLGSETANVDLISASVVRVETRFPPGSR